MLVWDFGFISDLNVDMEMEFWTVIGSLFHSRVVDGKNDLKEDVRRVCLGTMVDWLQRL